MLPGSASPRHQHLRDLGDIGAVGEVLEHRRVWQPIELQHPQQFGGGFEELDQSPLGGLEVTGSDPGRYLGAVRKDE